MLIYMAYFNLYNNYVVLKVSSTILYLYQLLLVNIIFGVKRIIETCMHFYDRLILLIVSVYIIGSKHRYIYVLIIMSTYKINRIIENTDDKHIGKYLDTKI